MVREGFLGAIRAKRLSDHPQPIQSGLVLLPYHRGFCPRGPLARLQRQCQLSRLFRWKAERLLRRFLFEWDLGATITVDKYSLDLRYIDTSKHILPAIKAATISGVGAPAFD